MSRRASQFASRDAPSAPVARVYFGFSPAAAASSSPSIIRSLGDDREEETRVAYRASHNTEEDDQPTAKAVRVARSDDALLTNGARPATRSHNWAGDAGDADHYLHAGPMPMAAADTSNDNVDISPSSSSTSTSSQSAGGVERTHGAPTDAAAEDLPSRPSSSRSSGDVSAKSSSSSWEAVDGESSAPPADAVVEEAEGNGHDVLPRMDMGKAGENTDDAVSVDHHLHGTTCSSPPSALLTEMPAVPPRTVLPGESDPQPAESHPSSSSSPSSGSQQSLCSSSVSALGGDSESQERLAAAAMVARMGPRRDSAVTTAAETSFTVTEENDKDIPGSEQTRQREPLHETEWHSATQTQTRSYRTSRSSPLPPEGSTKVSAAFLDAISASFSSYAGESDVDESRFNAAGGGGAAQLHTRGKRKAAENVEQDTQDTATTSASRSPVTASPPSHSSPLVEDNQKSQPDAHESEDNVHNMSAGEEEEDPSTPPEQVIGHTTLAQPPLPMHAQVPKPPSGNTPPDDLRQNLVEWMMGASRSMGYPMPVVFATGLEASRSDTRNFVAPPPPLHSARDVTADGEYRMPAQAGTQRPPPSPSHGQPSSRPPKSSPTRGTWPHESSVTAARGGSPLTFVPDLDAQPTGTGTIALKWSSLQRADFDNLELYTVVLYQLYQQLAGQNNNTALYRLLRQMEPAGADAGERLVHLRCCLDSIEGPRRAMRALFGEELIIPVQPCALSDESLLTLQETLAFAQYIKDHTPATADDSGDGSDEESAAHPRGVNGELSASSSRRTLHSAHTRRTSADTSSPPHPPRHATRALAAPTATGASGPSRRHYHPTSPTSDVSSIDGLPISVTSTVRATTASSLTRPPPHHPQPPRRTVPREGDTKTASLPVPAVGTSPPFSPFQLSGGHAPSPDQDKVNLWLRRSARLLPAAFAQMSDGKPTVPILTFLSLIKEFQLRVDLSPFHGLKIDRQLNGTLTRSDFDWIVQMGLRVCASSEPIFGPRFERIIDAYSSMRQASFRSMSLDGSMDGVDQDTIERSCDSTFNSPPRPGGSVASSSLGARPRPASSTSAAPHTQTPHGPCTPLQSYINSLANSPDVSRTGLLGSSAEYPLIKTGSALASLLRLLHHAVFSQRHHSGVSREASHSVTSYKEASRALMKPPLPAEQSGMMDSAMLDGDMVIGQLSYTQPLTAAEAGGGAGLHSPQRATTTPLLAASSVDGMTQVPVRTASQYSRASAHHSAGAPPARPLLPATVGPPPLPLRRRRRRREHSSLGHPVRSTAASSPLHRTHNNKNSPLRLVASLASGQSTPLRRTPLTPAGCAQQSRRRPPTATRGARSPVRHSAARVSSPGKKSTTPASRTSSQHAPMHQQPRPPRRVPSASRTLGPVLPGAGQGPVAPASASQPILSMDWWLSFFQPPPIPHASLETNRASQRPGRTTFPAGAAAAAVRASNRTTRRGSQSPSKAAHTPNDARPDFRVAYLTADSSAREAARVRRRDDMAANHAARQRLKALEEEETRPEQTRQTFAHPRKPRQDRRNPRRPVMSQWARDSGYPQDPFPASEAEARDLSLLIRSRDLLLDTIARLTTQKAQAASQTDQAVLGANIVLHRDALHEIEVAISAIVRRLAGRGAPVVVPGTSPIPEDSVTQKALMMQDAHYSPERFDSGEWTLGDGDESRGAAHAQGASSPQSLTDSRPCGHPDTVAGVYRPSDSAPAVGDPPGRQASARSSTVTGPLESTTSTGSGAPAAQVSSHTVDGTSFDDTSDERRASTASDSAAAAKLFVDDAPPHFLRHSHSTAGAMGSSSGEPGRSSIIAGAVPSQLSVNTEEITTQGSHTHSPLSPPAALTEVTHHTRSGGGARRGPAGAVGFSKDADQSGLNSCSSRSKSSQAMLVSASSGGASAPTQCQSPFGISGLTGSDGSAQPPSYFAYGPHGAGSAQADRSQTTGSGEQGRARGNSWRATHVHNGSHHSTSHASGIVMNPTASSVQNTPMRSIAGLSFPSRKDWLSAVSITSSLRLNSNMSSSLPISRILADHLQAASFASQSPAEANTSIPLDALPDLPWDDDQCEQQSTNSGPSRMLGIS